MRAPSVLASGPAGKHWGLVLALTSLLLASCATRPAPETSTTTPVSHPKALWQPVAFTDLPDWPEPSLYEAWGAWLTSCQRPHAAWERLCPDIRRLSIGSEQDKQQWIESNLQPYQVTTLEGEAKGLLTSYFEPEFTASRLPVHANSTALYRPPADLRNKSPWYSRREIDTVPDARNQLRGRELVYLNHPIDALILHIQGSGKARVQEPDGQQRWVRMAFAATNEHAYKSVARWLIDQGQLRDTSWPAIREWANRNPARVQEMLWSNPRFVFFKEETLSELDKGIGPKGAQGVPLTAGRSIAVDPGAMPYGTPVWISTRTPTLSTSRLVMAQDTGSAITGAVRADFYAGTGAVAGELAGRVKQDFGAWVLWPK
jgi:membrane-bound lytic murein transglycosylase A